MSDQLRARLGFGFRVALFLLVAVGGAYRQTAQAGAALRAHSAYGAIAVVPVLAALVAVIRGVGLRRTLHIHDRHVDVLLSIALLGAAITSTALFGPRLWWAETVLRLDLLARPLWVGAAFAALFGTRPMLEQLPSLGVLGATWPTPYILAATVLPAGTLAPFILVVAFSAAVAATMREPVVRQMLLALTGVVVGVAWLVVVPASPWLAPAVAGGVIVGLVFALGWKWMLRGDPASESDADAPPAVTKVRLSTVVPLLGIAVVAAALPAQDLRSANDPGVTVPRGCPAVTGWKLETRTRYRADLGHSSPASITHRCRYRVGVGPLSRSIAIDVTPAATYFDLGASPLPTMFPGPGRLDPVDRKVRLDGGRADVFNWNDANVPTEVLVVSWYATSGESGKWHRVSVVVPDDRTVNAYIPAPVGSYVQAVKAVGDRVLSVVRTRRDELHKYSVPPKDLDRAVAYARKLVVAWQS